MPDDVRAAVLDLMASRPGPWFVYDIYKAVQAGPGCKWFDILVAMTSLEEQGKITSHRVATGNPDHPVRRGWELA